MSRRIAAAVLCFVVVGIIAQYFLSGSLIRSSGAIARSNEMQQFGEIIGIDTARILQTSVRYRYPIKLLQQPTDLLIGITSTPPNRRMRDAIRDTWGRNHHLLFLLAGNLTKDLQSEFLQNQDILLLDRPESYLGLPYKTFCLLDVVRRHAVQFEYLYKTDDDVYLNIYKLQDMLTDKFQLPDYLGKTLHMEIIRDPQEKWYVSEEEYPNATHFHPFNIGAGYAISSKVLQNNPCVARELERQPFLNLEDVSVGWVMHKCKIPYNYDRWDHWDNPWLFEYGYLQRWDDFQTLFRTDRRTMTVVNLYEIKTPDILHRMHVEYCLDHHRGKKKKNGRNNKNYNGSSLASPSLASRNCKGFDFSCAAKSASSRSANCHFVKCGHNRTALNCESCPLISSPSTTEYSELCGGADCQWCRFGVAGYNADKGFLRDKFYKFQKLPERCVPRIGVGPICRTREEAKKIAGKE